MAGNRAIYDRAMDQSREASRQARWDDALKGAVRALQEFPQELEARTLAAVALFNTNKHAQALQAFEGLRAADANNPFYLDYIARAQEQLGDKGAAIQTYIALADLHASHRLNAKTIEALRATLRLRPDLAEQRVRLAQLLEEASPVAAAAEYLTLAEQMQRTQRLDDAAMYAETTLRLDPASREAKEFLVALREAMAASVRDDVTAAPGGEFRPSMAGMTGGLRSQQVAVERIIADASNKQENGDIDGAVEGYERAINLGSERVDVFYSLGLIYQERGEHQQAVDQLVRVVNDPDYALSAHFALGSSYKELGQLREAAGEFEQTIRLVDLESISKAESEELVQMYDNAADIYIQIGDMARAASLYSTLAGFLQTKRWGKEQAAEFNQKAKALAERNMFAKLRTLGTGALAEPPIEEAAPQQQSETMPETWGKIRPITDFLRPDRVAQSTDGLEADPGFAPVSVTPAALDPLAALEALPPERPTFAPVTALDTTGLAEQTERWVTASERYIEQGLLEAALDACMEVIGFDIEYLPIHLRMGQIYERQSRPEDALAKYQLLIDTYTIRQEQVKAIDVYYRLIDLSPDTINPRSRLAELLRADGRVDEAADQLALVAGSYFRLGQTNRSLEEYRRLLQWVPRSKEVHTQYGTALLKLERYETALAEFRKALELGADDPPAIARINIALAMMGEQPVLIWDSLASVLEHIKQQPQTSGLVQNEYRTTLLTSDAPILHYMLAIIQQQSSQHQSALLELEAAASILEGDDQDPILPEVLVRQALADSYIALGQADDALDQLRKGQALQRITKPNPAIRHAFATPLARGDLVRRMAEAYAATENMDGAERALLEAKTLLPYDRTIYTKLADVYFRQGRLQDALTQLDELATHYENRQDLDKALETLAYGLRLAPSNVPVGVRYANMLLRRGYLDKGVDNLVRVSDLQRKAGQIKDAVASLQRAADVHWTLGQQDKAQVLYDKIVHIAPNDVEARQWLSFMHTLAFRTADAIAEKKHIVRIFAQQRDYDNAIAELSQIIALDQKDLDAYYMWGDMLMRRGEYSQALQLYTRMLKMEGIEHARLEALRTAASRMLTQQQTLRNS